MKRLLVVLMTIFAVGLQPLVCGAESLWQDNSKMSSLYRDIKARNVGDVITIMISETSNATRSGTANNSKSANIDVGAGQGSLLNWIAAHNVEASDSFRSQGNIANTNRFSANITVQVVGVKPNGNLLLSGTQSIKQNRDLQMITITGEVRPEDVSSNNTVLSTYVANAQITVDGKGPLMRKQRQGILTQVLNFMF